MSLFFHGFWFAAQTNPIFFLGFYHFFARSFLLFPRVTCRVLPPTLTVEFCGHAPSWAKSQPHLNFPFLFRFRVCWGRGTVFFRVSFWTPPTAFLNTFFSNGGVRCRIFFASPPKVTGSFDNQAEQFSFFSPVVRRNPLETHSFPRITDLRRKFLVSHRVFWACFPLFFHVLVLKRKIVIFGNPPFLSFPGSFWPLDNHHMSFLVPPCPFSGFYKNRLLLHFLNFCGGVLGALPTGMIVHFFFWMNPSLSFLRNPARLFSTLGAGARASKFPRFFLFSPGVFLEIAFPPPKRRAYFFSPPLGSVLWTFPLLIFFLKARFFKFSFFVGGKMVFPIPNPQGSVHPFFFSYPHPPPTKILFVLVPSTRVHRFLHFTPGFLCPWLVSRPFPHTMCRKPLNTFLFWH